MNGLLWWTMCLAVLQEGQNLYGDGHGPATSGPAAVSYQDPYAGNPASGASGSLGPAPEPSSVYDGLRGHANGASASDAAGAPPTAGRPATAAPPSTVPATSMAPRSTIPGSRPSGYPAGASQPSATPPSNGRSPVGGSGSISGGLSTNEWEYHQRSGGASTAEPRTIENPNRPNPQPARPPVNDQSARAMIEAVFNTAAPWELPGRPITLETALGVATDSTTRLQIIRAYWKLSRTIADGRFANYKKSLAQQPAASASGYEGALFQAILAEANSEMKTSRLRALDAQRELARWINAAPDALPLPADPPLAGAYITRFEQVFQGRFPSAEARQINELLPEIHELVALRGDAALAFNEATEGVTSAFAARRETATNVAAMIEKTQAAQSAFLDVLYVYNDRIARYAMEAGGSVNSSRAVSMLLQRRATAMVDGSEVQTAAALAPADERPSLSILR